jgi:dephospho-CoA kinase
VSGAPGGSGASDGSGHVGRTLMIGITGPIGCGKSTILGWLAARGALVIDADQVVREVTAPGSAVVAEIVAAFGPGVAGASGALDRAALGTIVFEDPAALRRLEAITHPVVRARILATMRDAEAAAVPIVALEAIRLVEAGYPALLDEVWLVTCDPPRQLERLEARGLAPADAAARTAAQATLVERVRPVATRVIDTSGTLAEAEIAVDAALSLARRSIDPGS